MYTMKMSKKLWILVVLCILAEQVNCKSGRVGTSFGRGSSGARSSVGSGFGRSSGGFGGRTGTGSGGFSSGRYTGGGTSSRGNYGSGGIIGGRNTGYSNRGGHTGSGMFSGIGRKNHYSGGGYGGTSRYSKGSGIGSALRSNTFKNVIVGAAAGYLAYQGGKYLIRSAMAPMMWNQRPYYWGSSYYQARPNTQMCRMPVDQSDPTLGNVYFQDQSRPREIVWGCGMNEHCCGYECCPSGMSGMGSGMPMGDGGVPMSGGGVMSGGGAALPAYCKVDGTGFDLSLRPAQSVGVRGQLKCNGMPAGGILVKLYDHDTFTLDDKIAEGTTDAQGNFCIAGHANEISRITPKFNIYHDCNDYLPCQRKLSMYIPKNFISDGAVPYNVYDAGVLELSAKMEGEERDCFHK